MITPSAIKKAFSILKETHQPTMLEQLGNYTPFQMLVMTLLSARTKDSTVIPLVKKMFADYPHPQDFAVMKREKLEQILYGVGFYKVKAKHVQELSKILLEKYNGKVPDNFEELVSLPGVGRKTASCVLAYTFHQPAIAVDTHVHRISNRLGWVKSKKTEETEEMLKRVVPREAWIDVNSLLVDHGQRICTPLRPKCTQCPIVSYCEYGKNKMS